MSNVVTLPSQGSKPSESQLKAEDLRQFYGDIIRFTHPLNRTVIYSPGVQYVADRLYHWNIHDKLPPKKLERRLI